MALVYGQGTSISVEMAGPFANGGSSGKMTEIVLPASDWKNGESPFYQRDIPVNGLSANSIIELMADTDIIEKLHHTALMAVNEEGSVTVYAFGDKPTESLTLNAVLTEVVSV